MCFKHDDVGCSSSHKTSPGLLTGSITGHRSERGDWPIPSSVDAKARGGFSKRKNIRILWGKVGETSRKAPDRTEAEMDGYTKAGCSFAYINNQDIPPRTNHLREAMRRPGWVPYLMLLRRPRKQMEKEKERQRKEIKAEARYSLLGGSWALPLHRFFLEVRCSTFGST